MQWQMASLGGEKIYYLTVIFILGNAMGVSDLVIIHIPFDSNMDCGQERIRSRGVSYQNGED